VLYHQFAQIHSSAAIELAEPSKARRNIKRPVRRNTKRTCKAEGCDTLATFGDTLGKPLFCKKHMLAEHTDVLNKRCEAEDCDKIAGFGNPQDRRPRFCVWHKRDIDVNIAGISCLEPGCSVQASYGDPKVGIAVFCKAHKQNGHEDVCNNRCEHVGCRTLASYGCPSEGKRRFCKTHSRAGDKNLITPTCKFKETYADPNIPPFHCEKQQPVFGYEDQDIPLYCFAHKQEGMVNLVKLECTVEGCSNPRTYGSREEGTAQRCKEHMRPDDVSRRTLRLRMRKALNHKTQFESIRDSVPQDSKTDSQPSEPAVQL
jgi:hypothetical protein